MTEENRKLQEALSKAMYAIFRCAELSNNQIKNSTNEDLIEVNLCIMQAVELISKAQALHQDATDTVD
jgi:hypothetical protein